MLIWRAYSSALQRNKCGIKKNRHFLSFSALIMIGGGRERYTFSALIMIGWKGKKGLLKSALLSYFSIFIFMLIWRAYSSALQKKKQNKTKQNVALKNPVLFSIFGTYHDRAKKVDTSLSKTGTFVLFQHFFMHAYMMRKKKCGIKNRHFSAFSALIMFA